MEIILILHYHCILVGICGNCWYYYIFVVSFFLLFCNFQISFKFFFLACVNYVNFEIEFGRRSKLFVCNLTLFFALVINIDFLTHFLAIRLDFIFQTEILIFSNWTKKDEDEEEESSCIRILNRINQFN